MSNNSFKEIKQTRKEENLFHLLLHFLGSGVFWLNWLGACGGRDIGNTSALELEERLCWDYAKGTRYVWIKQVDRRYVGVRKLSTKYVGVRPSTTRYGGLKPSSTRCVGVCILRERYVGLRQFSDTNYVKSRYMQYTLISQFFAAKLLKAIWVFNQRRHDMLASIRRCLRIRLFVD